MNESSGGEGNNLTENSDLAQSVATALDSSPQFNKMNLFSTYDPQEKLDLAQLGFKVEMANTHGMSLEQIQRDHGVSIDVARQIQTERLNIAEETYRTAYAEGQSVDGMTGLLNEVGFETVVKEILPLLVDRMNYPDETDYRKISEAVFAIIMVDVNHLRDVNNAKWGGHVMGDKLIIGISESLKISIRSSDFAARIGGDEVIIGLPITQDMGVTPAEIIKSLTTAQDDSDGFVSRLYQSVEKFQKEFWRELQIRGATYDELREKGIGTLSLGLVVFDRSSLAQALDAYDGYIQNCKQRGIKPDLSFTNFAIKPFADKLMYSAKEMAHTSGNNELKTGLCTIDTGGFTRELIEQS